MKTWLITILSAWGETRVVTRAARSAAEAIQLTDVGDAEHIANCVPVSEV